MHTTTTSVIFEFRQIRDTTGGPGLMMRIHPDEFNKALFFKRKSDGIWQLTLPAVEDMNEEVEEEDPDEPMVVAIVNANLAKKKHVRFIDLSTGEVGYIVEPLTFSPKGYEMAVSGDMKRSNKYKPYKMLLQKAIIDGAKLVKREDDGIIELRLPDLP
jgi:hypothetical protein